jgi:hypothetical protein
MYSQKAGKSPLAEKRLIYSSIKRGTFGRRCYSESTCVKKKNVEAPQPPPTIPVLEIVELSAMPCVQAH